MVNKEQEQELNDIAENIPSVVMIGKKKVKVGWMKRGALRKFTAIMLDKREDIDTESKVSCKLAATVVLNDIWKIKFYHWLLWRWYYYIRQYSDKVLIPIIEEGKKKVLLSEYYSIMMLAHGLRDTQKTMTRDEVSRFRQELLLEQKEQ